MSGKRRLVYLSRTESFSASHRLHSTQLSEEENEKLYGKDHNPNGHGHNYKVEVIIRGEVNPVTGMIMNLTDLKHYINEACLEVMDHKHIDADIPYFKDIVSSAENMVVYIWDRLEALLPSGLLYEVRLAETDKNLAFYRGETI